MDLYWLKVLPKDLAINLIVCELAKTTRGPTLASLASSGSTAQEEIAASRAPKKNLNDFEDNLEVKMLTPGEVRRSLHFA